jgi:hypothetical protein
MIKPKNERNNRRAFLNITEEKLKSYGMKGGPASYLADFAKKCKEKKKGHFLRTRVWRKY